MRKQIRHMAQSKLCLTTLDRAPEEVLPASTPRECVLAPSSLACTSHSAGDCARAWPSRGQARKPAAAVSSLSDATAARRGHTTALLRQRQLSPAPKSRRKQRQSTPGAARYRRREAAGLAPSCAVCQVDLMHRTMIVCGAAPPQHNGCLPVHAQRLDKRHAPFLRWTLCSLGLSSSSSWSRSCGPRQSLASSCVRGLLRFFGLEEIRDCSGDRRAADWRAG